MVASSPMSATPPAREVWQGRGSVLVGFALLAALHCALAVPMRAPLIFGDEVASLGIARFLAGHPPYPLLAHPVQGWAPFYRFGYPLLVAPLWLFTRDPLAVYKAALFLNGFLLSSLFPLLVSFARRTLALPRRDALLAAFAASLYPAFLLQSNFTWSESLLIPVVTGVVVSFQRLVERPGVGGACAFALLAVFAYAVHERALGLVPLSLLALAALWRGGRLPGRAALAAIGAAIAAFTAVRTLDARIFEQLWASSPQRLGTGDLIVRLVDPESLGKALLSLTGQVWYLTTASALLFPLGLWVLVRTVRQGEAAEQRLTALFLLAVAVVLLATSSLFVTRFPRTDLAIYGRYAEVFLGPFLVAGCAAFQGVARRHRLAALGLALLPGLLAALLLAGHDDAVFRLVYNQMNLLGLMPAVMLFGGIRMLRIAALGTAAGLAILGAGLVRPRAAAMLAGALFLVGGLWFHQGWRGGVQNGAFVARSVPRVVLDLGAREVAYDLAGATHDEFFAYQHRLGDTRLVFFDDRSAPPPRELVISDKVFGRRHPEARLVFPERRVDQALWVLPGPLLDRLEREGRLFPVDPGAPLPPQAVCARLAWIEAPEPRLVLDPGETRRLDVRLTHCGRNVPWLPFGARKDPAGAVRFGIRWYRGGAFVAEQRAELPTALAPGATIDASFDIAAHTGNGTPLPPGLYEVRIDLVQELVRWFGGEGLKIQAMVE